MYLVAVGLALLGLPASAQAHTTISCEPCSHPYQRWVDEAKVPTPDVTLALIEEPCPLAVESPACTRQGSYAIWEDPQTILPRETFLHELGHNFDYYVLPEWARSYFRWLTDDFRDWTADPNGPNEHFAMAYAACALTGAKFRGDPELNIKGNGARIRQKTYRRVCRMIAYVG